MAENLPSVEECPRCHELRALGFYWPQEDCLICNMCHDEVEEAQAEKEEAGENDEAEMDQSFSMVDYANSLLRTVGALQISQ